MTSAETSYSEWFPAPDYSYLSELSDDDLLAEHLDALSLDKANPRYNSTHPDLLATRTELANRRMARR